MKECSTQEKNDKKNMPCKGQWFEINKFNCKQTKTLDIVSYAIFSTNDWNENTLTMLYRDEYWLFEDNICAFTRQPIFSYMPLQ